jgi:hypothetical protein
MGRVYGRSPHRLPVTRTPGGHGAGRHARAQRRRSIRAVAKYCGQTVSEQLLDLLKLGMLLLVYLFFARVMWAVWSELREPTPARAGGRGEARAAPGRRRRAPASPEPVASPRSSVSVVRVVQPVSLAGAEYPLAGELTIGRSPACTVVIDDTYVSQRHAAIRYERGAHRIEDLGSTNGTLVNGKELTAPAVLRPGDRIQVGDAVLELR